MTDFIKSTIEGFIQDSAVGFGEDYAGEHFQPTSDPFYEDKKNEKGEVQKVRRRLPDNLNFSKQDSKHWKQVQTKAWIHDKSICGCCCWTDFIGWAPIVTILPIIGPLCMYSVHKKLIVLADKHFNLPGDLKTKMYGNIGIDLLISLVPILGSVFAWLHACSTRNAAMIFNFVVERQTKEYNKEKLKQMGQGNTKQTGQQAQLGKQQQQQTRVGQSQRYQQNNQRVQPPPLPQNHPQPNTPPIPARTQQPVTYPSQQIPSPPNAHYQQHSNQRRQPYPPQESEQSYYNNRNQY